MTAQRAEACALFVHFLCPKPSVGGTGAQAQTISKHVLGCAAFDMGAVGVFGLVGVATCASDSCDRWPRWPLAAGRAGRWPLVGRRQGHRGTPPGTVDQEDDTGNYM